MVEMIIIVGSSSLLAAIIGALIALGIQRGSLNKIQARNEAWERAQEAHQHDWEMNQEKHAATVEMRLIEHVQQVQKVWEEWEAKDQQRLNAIAKQHEGRVAELHVEHELARLPRIEYAPLTLDATHEHQYRLPGWQPPMLQASNLSERDLSHRYLGFADLRNAQLTNANLFMADLSGALLTGADLSGADFSGANLAGADLRGTTLTDTNFLVADLHTANLAGTDLLGARNLTKQQINSAFYDSSTQMATEVDITHPHLPALQPVMPLSPLGIPAATNLPQVMSTNGIVTTTKTTK